MHRLWRNKRKAQQFGYNSIIGEGFSLEKKPINGEHLAVSPNNIRTSQPHYQGYFNTHSSCLENGDSNMFKKAVQKVELPKFDGQDTIGWLTMAEKCFEVQKSKPELPKHRREGKYL